MSGSLSHADVRPMPDDPSAWRRQVAQAFSRASGRYTQLAQAQQQMGAALWEHLPARAEVVLDLGCGPGHWSRRLAAHFGPH
ncbi:MAG: class I SAM-dependent methyltransferase, partial [Billgrantia desiderata]